MSEPMIGMSCVGLITTQSRIEFQVTFHKLMRLILGIEFFDMEWNCADRTIKMRPPVGEDIATDNPIKHKEPV